MTEKIKPVHRSNEDPFIQKKKNKNTKKKKTIIIESSKINLNNIIDVYA